jgi:hypothetical protein
MNEALLDAIGSLYPWGFLVIVLLAVVVAYVEAIMGEE